MAILLLIYILVCVFWLVRSGLLTFIIFKHRFPGKEVVYGLIAFWSAAAVIFVFSILFILGADWVGVPDFMKVTGV